ncbi:hypothetical protein NDU88_000499 [Pleurodeles waltl]|uniref:KRAB domain-containing protein n=1 Tax=Pleurodeles waltl TaxID=8319 RepID=A0AAV7N8A1_PLEWA|nr:hypothetical protein NDU88_000499 [Pleurodeles waltl]
MDQRESGSTLLTFQDVVACFSHEEWELLHKWQKTLYANVMKEIHQILMSLGPVIATAIFSLRAKEKEDLCPLGSEGADRRYSDNHSPSVTVFALDAFPVSKEDSQFLKNPLSTDRRRCSDLLNRDGQDCIVPHITDRKESTNPLRRDRRESHNLLSTDRRESPGLLCTDRRKSPNLPSTGMAVMTSLALPDMKKEAEACSMQHQESKTKENISNLTGDPVTASVTLQSFADEKTQFQQELDDERGLTGMADIISLIVPEMKEEADTYSMDCRESELKRSINNLLVSEAETSEKESHVWGRGRATKKDGHLVRELRVAANTGAAGALRWQENILCTATPAPTTVVPRTEAWRHREGELGGQELATCPRAWLERQSRVKGEPRMARPWNKLTIRGTVRSSLHGILRSPGEICRGVKDPYSTRRPCRRARTTQKVQTNGDGEFQRAHRVGPKRSCNPSRPRPIIACLLRHNQTRQILQAAHKHGPFQMDQHDIRITADYSKETNDRRKAF